MVERYTPMYAETATDRYCRMLNSPTGGFVLASDYDALRLQLADIESQNRVMWDVASDREAQLAEAEATSLARYESLHDADKRLAEAEADNARLVAANKARDEFLRGHRYKHSEVDGYIDLCESQMADLKAQLAEAQDELAQWRATGESVTRNEYVLSARLAEAKADMARLLRDGIVNAPCPTPGQWRQLQDFAKGYLAGADSAVQEGQ